MNIREEKGAGIGEVGVVSGVEQDARRLQRNAAGLEKTRKQLIFA